VGWKHLFILCLQVVNLEERERYNQLLQLTDPASSHKHQHHQRNGRKLSTEERILRVSPMKRDDTVNDKHTHMVQRMDNAMKQLKDLTHDHDGMFIQLLNIITILPGTITLDDDNNQTTTSTSTTHNNSHTHRHTSSDSVIILRDTVSPSTSTTSSTSSSWVDARERTHELTQRFACFDPKEILENMWVFVEGRGCYNIYLYFAVRMTIRQRVRHVIVWH
jgi:hypothetical protein